MVNAGSAPDTGTAALDDLDGEIYRVYGIRRPCLVLDRPDGHIGARASTSDGDALAGYQRRWLSEAG